jgi:hypothetical protein
MAGRYGPLAFGEIDAALSEPEGDVPPEPVSCAALVARRMGASERHAVMAAGCAGGIGLCGGTCGALGAAVWVEGMTAGDSRSGMLGFRDPRRQALVDRLLKRTDYTLECARIAGRRFESVADHASYLREGGCAKVLEALAAG